MITSVFHSEISIILEFEYEYSEKRDSTYMYHLAYCLQVVVIHDCLFRKLE